MEIFNFFVAHDCPQKKVDEVQVFERLSEWIEQRPATVDRCAGKNGKIVKFNKKKFLSALQINDGKDISLYSERVWDDEVDEFLNCDFSVSYSRGEELFLSASKAKLSLQALVESFWGLGELVELGDYAYAYSETQAFGFGYGIGVSMPDDDHPLLWEGHARVGAWRKMQWAGKADEFIRDVYPVNIFSRRRIKALPQDKGQALIHAMEHFGERSVKKGFTVWILDRAEVEKARSYLKGFNLLASYT